MNVGKLRVKEGAPTLKMTDYVYEKNDIIFEYCVAYYRADRKMFSVEIDRENKDKSRDVEKFSEWILISTTDGIILG